MKKNIKNLYISEEVIENLEKDILEETIEILRFQLALFYGDSKEQMGLIKNYDDILTEQMIKLLHPSVRFSLL